MNGSQGKESTPEGAEGANPRIGIEKKKNEWRKNNPERWKAYHTKWKEKHPNYITEWRKKHKDSIKLYRAAHRDVQKNSDLLRMYKISLKRYNNLLAVQNGVCCICQQPPELKKRLAVDHDDGGVRGLLCAACNTGLGQFKDSLYLLKCALVYLAMRKSQKGDASADKSIVVAEAV